MPRPYAESPADDGDTMPGGIIGQVSGPKSWSEYDTSAPPDDMSCDMGRRNCTPFRDDVPTPR
jgi:hypothetical protein